MKHNKFTDIKNYQTNIKWNFKKYEVFKGQFSHKVFDQNKEEVNLYQHAKLIVKAVNSIDLTIKAFNSILDSKTLAEAKNYAKEALSKM